MNNKEKPKRESLSKSLRVCKSDWHTYVYNFIWKKKNLKRSKQVRGSGRSLDSSEVKRLIRWTLSGIYLNFTIRCYKHIAMAQYVALLASRDVATCYSISCANSEDESHDLIYSFMGN